MSIVSNLVNGSDPSFRTDSLSALQKTVLRTVVTGFLFYALAAVEGLMMRAREVAPIDAIGTEHFFSIMTVHPIVGIFGSTYLIVFGAFTFLVPYLMKKSLFSVKLANWTLGLIAGGALLSWSAGFLFHYAPLYTLYWPLPVDFRQFEAVGALVFVLGVALIMLGTITFIYNIYATVLSKTGEQRGKTTRELLFSGFGIDGILNLWNRMRGKPPYSTEPPISLPVVAIFRGTVDTFLDSLVILSAGVLILVYIFAHLLGNDLNVASVNSLLYKNWFWWGLDLIADGLVLIYVAGAWYLLATIITGKKLFMENVARAALLLELVVSWAVWSHHLLSDQGQPEMMKLVSGEMVTAFELVTQGLALYITLVTLWRGRPLKMTMELKFLLGGLIGFGLAVPAGIIQADMGMNRILHNTQWIIGAHVHMAILVGLTMTLYSAVYVLLPLLTNGAKLYSMKLANIHFWFHLIGGMGMSAFMGMAGVNGMLRRHLYENGEFNVYMILSAIFGVILLAGFLAFLFNVILTVGLKGLIGIYMPAKNPAASYPAELETA